MSKPASEQIFLELARAMQSRQAQGRAWDTLPTRARREWIVRAFMLVQECPTLLAVLANGLAVDRPLDLGIRATARPVVPGL